MLFYIFGLIFVSIVFACDILFGLGAISMLYLMFLLLTFAMVRSNLYIISSMITSVILTSIGWFYQSRQTITTIDVGVIMAELNYESLFRAVSILLTIFLGSVLFKAKIKKDELQELNESLDLRIFAKTAISEAKARRLEAQIEALKQVKYSDTKTAISKLDDIILELKELNQFSEEDN
jgi:hypothetical protein